MDQEKKDKTKKTFLVMAIIIAVFIVATLVFWEILKYSIFVKTFNYVVQNIIDISGMSHWLAKGIVILACIPFFLALIEVLKLRVKLNIFKKKPVRSYRKISFFVVILYIAAYFFCMFFMSKNTYFSHSGNDLKPTKYYAVTPEGLKFYDTPGRDPKYGKELKPVTPEMIDKYERAKLGKKPKKVSINQDTEYFDSITGEPKLWYFVDPTGNYEFYDQPGYQSIYLEELKPVNPQAILAFKESLEKKSKAQADENKKADAIAEKAILESTRIDKEKARRNYLESNIDTTIVKTANRTDVAILIINRDNESGTSKKGSLNDRIVESVNDRQTAGISGFFNEGFIENGNFKKVYQGRREVVKDLGLERYVDYILLGIEAEESIQNHNLSDLYSCKIEIEIKIISAKSGEVLGSSTCQGAGVGIDKEKAAIQARQRVAEKLKPYILSIIQKNNRP
jgi:hypothetical protein